MLVQESLVAITMPWFWESAGEARPARSSLDLEALKPEPEQVTKSAKCGFQYKISQF